MKWISISDKLPVADRTIVAGEFLDNDELFIDIMHLSEHTSKDSFTSGVRGLHEKRYWRVTHWLELPLHPKKNKLNNE